MTRPDDQRTCADVLSLWPVIGSIPFVCAECGKDVNERMTAYYRHGHHRGKTVATSLPPEVVWSIYAILHGVCGEISRSKISGCKTNLLHGFTDGLHSHLFKNGHLDDDNFPNLIKGKDK